MSSRYTCWRSLPLALLLALVAASAIAEEPYYTWVDENGIVNFSQQNPKDVDAILVTRGHRYSATSESAALESGRPGKVAAPEAPVPEEETASEKGETGESAAKPSPTDQQLDEQMATERQKVQAEIARARASNCEMGKRNLARLEAYARIRIKEADGSERILTDQEKADRTAQAKKTITENCGPG